MAVKLRLPLTVGVPLELAGSALGVIVLLQVDPSNPFFSNLAFTATGFTSLWYFPHSLTHFTIGRILGVRFRYFYIAESGLAHLDNRLLKRLGEAMPTLGVRVERRGFKDIPPVRRAVMFLSGTVASLTLPCLSLYISLLAGESLIALLVTVALGGNFIFTLYFSPKVGDISRAVDALEA